MTSLLADDELGSSLDDLLAAGVHLVGERDVVGRIHGDGLLRVTGLHERTPFDKSD